MAWRKSPAKLIATFESVLPTDVRVQRRQMFGYPAAFANGNLFTGLHQDDLMIRLSAADREKLKDLGGKMFAPMPGRSMREYVVVPDAILSDKRALRRWLMRSLTFACSLPVKKPKEGGSKNAR
ncbi:MAG: TfoX/Sxy family protein [Alphaproteobacteria bacterium]|nr:TfoX/Sxy family protein [Alphaproteobacteria bacterium]